MSDEHTHRRLVMDIRRENGGYRTQEVTFSSVDEEEYRWFLAIAEAMRKGLEAHDFIVRLDEFTEVKRTL